MKVCMNISCIAHAVIGGGDASVTFEHAWGDGVAVLRFLNETLKENFEDPKITESCGENTKSADWSLLKFDLDEKVKNDILKAKGEYRKWMIGFDTDFC